MIVATKFRSPRDAGKYDKDISKKLRENCKITQDYFDTTNANYESNGVYYVEHPELTKELNEKMKAQRTSRQEARKVERESGVALANAISGMKAGMKENIEQSAAPNHEVEALKKQVADLIAMQNKKPDSEETTRRTRRTPKEMEEARKAEESNSKSN